MSIHSVTLVVLTLVLTCAPGRGHAAAGALASDPTTDDGGTLPDAWSSDGGGGDGAISDAGDGGPADAPAIVLLPDGAARGLVADDTGCSVAHRSASSAASVLAAAALLATWILRRRRGRS